MATTMLQNPPLVVSSRDLAQYHRQDVVADKDDERSIRIIPVDCTWYMPNTHPVRDPYLQHEADRIPRARFLPIDQVADLASGLPHMLPDAKTFSRWAGSKGIRRQDWVVFYDQLGVFSSPRGAFTFAAFGHDRVSVLDGGLPAWKKQVPNWRAGPVEADEPVEYPIPTLDPSFVRSYDQMLFNATEAESPDLVLDARPKGRFSGRSPEPRANLKSGHMPHSVSFPFDKLTKGGHLLPREELRKLFEEVLEPHQISLQDQGPKSRGLVTSCGSGMTAAILWLALRQAGVNQERLALYDGSWTEWAGKEGSPILRT